jgi:hypothetical protein
MEPTFSSETSLLFQRTTWRYVPEDITLHSHLRENLKSYRAWKSSSETSVTLCRATRHLVPDGINLHIQSRETLISYTLGTGFT